MKYKLTVLFSLFISCLYGQQEEKARVQKAIEYFFEGFHEQDSAKIKEVFSRNAIIQTIATPEDGDVKVENEDFATFLKSIVSIPKTTRFKEILKNFTIQIDGPMAHAWTPYEFLLDDTFHHCGVNSFQLVKKAERGWQIIYIIDTRRRSPCNKQ